MQAPFNSGYGAGRILKLLDCLSFKEHKLGRNLGDMEPLPPHLQPFREYYAKYRGFNVLALEAHPYYGRHPVKRFVIIFPKNIEQTHAIKSCLNITLRRRYDIRLFIDFPIENLLDGTDIPIENILKCTGPEAPYVSYGITDRPSALPPEYTFKDNTPDMWDCVMLMLSVFMKEDNTEYTAMKYIVLKLEQIFQRNKVPDNDMQNKYT